MIKLNLPPYPARVTEDQGKAKILDVLRRRYVALTPEEWVRQHFVHYLIEHKHYPAALLANEVRLTIGDKSVRADSVLYDASLHQSPRPDDRGVQGAAHPYHAEGLRPDQRI